jgi:hypothetical protein
MELLCPNCQQRVTVPDNLAGQAMKCPHCNNSFTTPSLAPAAASAFVAPPAPAAPVVAEPVVTASAAPAPAETALAAQTASAAPAVGHYRQRLEAAFSPRVLPWIAFACLGIVFILTFFSWAGYYPGGYPVATQNAWQAAFGSYSWDPDLVKVPPLSNADGKDQIQPGANGLLIVFILLFLLALIAAIFTAVVSSVPVALPPAIERLRPWFGAIVNVLIALALLFLVLQLFMGFSLTNRIRDRVQTIGAERANNAGNPTDKKLAEIQTTMLASAARDTAAAWWSFWLLFVPLIIARFYAVSRRTTRPPP